jgi:hypothetical protein
VIPCPHTLSVAPRGALPAVEPMSCRLSVTPTLPSAPALNSCGGSSTLVNAPVVPATDGPAPSTNSRVVSVTRRDVQYTARRQPSGRCADEGRGAHRGRRGRGTSGRARSRARPRTARGGVSTARAGRERGETHGDDLAGLDERLERAALERERREEREAARAGRAGRRAAAELEAQRGDDGEVDGERGAARWAGASAPGAEVEREDGPMLKAVWLRGRRTIASMYL